MAVPVRFTQDDSARPVRDCVALLKGRPERSGAGLFVPAGVEVLGQDGTVLHRGYADTFGAFQVHGQIIPYEFSVPPFEERAKATFPFPDHYAPPDVRIYPDVIARGEEVIISELVNGWPFRIGRHEGALIWDATVVMDESHIAVPKLDIRGEKIPDNTCLYGVIRIDGPTVWPYVNDVWQDGRWLCWDEMQDVLGKIAKFPPLPQLARAYWAPKSLWAKDTQEYRPICKPLSEIESRVDVVSRGIQIKLAAEREGKYGRVIAACENELAMPSLYPRRASGEPA